MVVYSDNCYLKHNVPIHWCGLSRQREIEIERAITQLSIRSTQTDEDEGVLLALTPREKALCFMEKNIR